MFNDSFTIAWLAYVHLSMIIIPGVLAASVVLYKSYFLPWYQVDSRKLISTPAAVSHSRRRAA